MKKTAVIYTIFFVLILSVFLMPAVGFAQEGLIVDCEGINEETGCTLKHLVDLVEKVINWIILIAAPVAMVMFAYAGIIMVTAGGSESKIKKAQGIFKNVAIGFVIILAAWLIVYTILNAFLGDTNLPVGL